MLGHLRNPDPSSFSRRGSNSSRRCPGVSSDLEQTRSLQRLHHAHHLYIQIFYTTEKFESKAPTPTRNGRARERAMR